MGELKNLDELKEIVSQLKTEGKKVVFTNGCFDILHAGHVSYLREARTLGDALIIGLNSDSSVRRIKGKKRPINPENERAEVLGALGFVDFVVIFEDSTPLKTIETILPDVLVKGADWGEGEIVGGEVVEKNGGEVVRIPLKEGASTTNIVERILERFGGAAT